MSDFENDGGSVMSIHDAAALWGISVRRVNRLCKDGRIPGAKKLPSLWIVPADATKPPDTRGHAPQKKTKIKACADSGATQGKAGTL